MTAAAQRRPGLAAAAAVIARPFAAAGGVVRTSVSMLFARGRGWGMFITRGRIDYRAEVGDPATNSIVGAVVGWVARNFPEAPVRIILETDPEAKPITRSATGPGAMLRLLERPNQYFSGVLQWMATIVDYVTDGNAYWIKVRSGAGRVVALWWVPQKMMQPRWPLDDPSTFIGWYEYTVDGIVYTVDPKDVVHLRNGLDPDNTRKGRSALKALLKEIFTDEEAATFTASLLHNLGVPGVVIAPANTTGSQRITVDADSIKEKFEDTFGADNRGKPLVLNTPTDIKVLSFNPQQMDLKALRRIPEERISANVGVPAGVAGLGAGLDRNTFTNFAEANRAAYTQGVIPLHRLIAAELEVQLLPEFVGDAIDTYDVFFDAAVTAAMAEAAGEVWKRAESAATKGLLRRSDFKRLTGQKPAPDGADDVYILPGGWLIVAAPDNGEARVLVGGKGAQPALPPGSRAEGEALQLSAGVTVLEPVEVRCANVRPTGETCDRLLATGIPPITAYCQRCKVETELGAVA